MYGQIFELIPFAIVVWRLVERERAYSLTLVVANAAAENQLGVESRKLAGKTIAECFPQVAHERVENLADVVRSGSVRQIEAFTVAIRGESRLVEATAIPLKDGCVALVFEDIAAKTRTASEMRKAQRFLDAIIENIPLMVFLKDGDLRFVRFNAAGERLLGHPREALIGKCDRDFFPPEQAEFFMARDREVLASGKLADIAEEPIETRTLGQRILHTQKVPLTTEDGSKFLLGISEDITVRKQAEQTMERQAAELQALALTDELTSLHNRRGFLLLAGQQLKLANRGRNMLVLFFLDVNGLKSINDKLGHALGDTAIADMARLMKASFREVDIVARLGGDEFVALSTAVEAPLIQARLQKAVDHENETSGRPYRLSFSMGETVYDPAQPRTIEQLVEEADSAMYDRKRSCVRDIEVSGDALAYTRRS